MDKNNIISLEAWKHNRQFEENTKAFVSFLKEGRFGEASELLEGEVLTSAKAKLHRQVSETT